MSKKRKNAGSPHTNLSAYNDILNRPPSWFSIPNKMLFNRCYKKVEDEASEILLENDETPTQTKINEMIIEWMNAADRHGVDGEDPDDPTAAPQYIKREVGALAHYRHTYSLGEKEVSQALVVDKVRELLMGEDAVSGRKVREGYKNREEYSYKKSYLEIAGKMLKANPDLTSDDILHSEEKELAKYKNLYTERTRRKWLKEIDPRLKERKRGRPKKNVVIP